MLNVMKIVIDSPRKDVTLPAVRVLKALSVT